MQPIPKRQQQIVVAGAVVLDGQGNVLLTRRNQPDLPGAHGRWEMPAGKVEFGELPHETAAREVLEETGYAVRVDPRRSSVKAMIWESDTKETHTILLAFRAEVVGGERTVQGGKVADVRWWPVSALPLDNILPLDDEMILALADEQDPLLAQPLVEVEHQIVRQ